MKFLLAGCGSIASRHIKEIMRLGTLVGVCDPDVKRLKECMDEYGVTGFKTFDEMMDADLTADVVVICSPNGYHATQSITAMEHGYHIICEKPMALNTEDAKSMIRIAKAHNKSVTIVKQNRFNGPIVQLKEWISSGASGQVYSISMNCLWNRTDAYYTSSSWRGTPKMDGGILYTQFSHYIDFLYWIFGEVDEIKSLSSNVHHRDLLSFADQGVVILKFTSGVLGTLHYSINAYEKNMESSLTVLAEHGSVRIGGLSCNVWEYQHIAGPPFNNPVPEISSNPSGVSNHHFVYDHVLKGLETGVYDEQSAFEAMKTVELIERIYIRS